MRSIKANDIIFKSEITPRLISFDPQENFKTSNTRICSVEKQKFINFTPLKQTDYEIKAQS